MIIGFIILDNIDKVAISKIYFLSFTFYIFSISWR